MRISKKKQTETETEHNESGKPAILEEFEQAEELQRIYRALKNYQGTDPDVLKARKKMEMARLRDQGEAIEKAHFGLIREGDNAPGRFVI